MQPQEAPSGGSVEPPPGYVEQPPGPADTWNVLAPFADPAGLVLIGMVVFLVIVMWLSRKNKEYEQER